MASKFYTIKKCIKTLYKFRYLFTCAFFLFLIGFLDSNSILRRYQLKQQINELHTQIDKYDAQYKTAQAALDRLQNDPKAMDEVARVKLFMKTRNEDVYVIE